MTFNNPAFRSMTEITVPDFSQFAQQLIFSRLRACHTRYISTVKNRTTKNAGPLKQLFVWIPRIVFPEIARRGVPHPRCGTRACPACLTVGAQRDRAGCTWSTTWSSGKQSSRQPVPPFRHPFMASGRTEVHMFVEDSNAAPPRGCFTVCTALLARINVQVQV